MKTLPVFVQIVIPPVNLVLDLIITNVYLVLETYICPIMNVFLYV